MKRVLLTGSTGFIGRHVLEALGQRSGLDIHTMHRRVPVSVPMGTTAHQGDVLDREAVTAVLRSVKPDTLLHFAWAVPPPGERLYERPENQDWADATVAMVQSFGEAGGQRVVIAGSCIEYGDLPSPFRESDSAMPTSLYGHEKLRCAQEVLQVNAALSVAVARIFFLFGPHEERSRLIPTVIANLLVGQPAALSAGTQRRDFMDVREVADAAVSIAESDVRGLVNIGSGEAISVADLARATARLLNGEHLLRFGEQAAGGDAAADIVAGIDRLRDEVGWRPRRSLDEALTETIAWWREALPSQSTLESTKNHD